MDLPPSCKECGEERPLDEHGLCEYCAWEWPDAETIALQHAIDYGQ